MNPTFLIWSCIACLVMVSKCSAFQVDEAKRDQAMFVLEGYKESLSKLNSGECSIRFSPQTSIAFRNAQNAKVMFDPSGYRMEWVYLRDKAMANFYSKHTDYKLAEDAETITGFYIRSQGKLIQWLEGQFSINILAPESNAMDYINLFDVRGVGFYSWLAFHQNIDAQKQIDHYLKKPIHDVNQKGDQLEIVWRVSRDTIEWAVTFDENQGYVPVSGRLRVRNNPREDWRLEQEIATEWKKISGAWVPVDALITFHMASNQTDERHLMLDWKTVNRPIPQHLFGFTSLGAPDEVRVVDFTLGSRVEIKAAFEPFQKVTEIEPGTSVVRIVMVILSVALIAGIFVWRWGFAK